jgi:hypothetical protein
MAKAPKGSKASTSSRAAPALPAGGPVVPITIPVPPAGLDKLVLRTSWPKADLIHRIHPDRFLGDQFNPGPNGNARFSPILDAKGNQIPTIYGGTTFDCAAMETVFHDVPIAPGLKTHAKRLLKAHHYSQVLPSADLVLADLTNTALRNLGIKRGELIESEKNVYPHTRAWAEAIHAQCPDVQGLYWVSRQDDRWAAIILFGDRLGLKPLTLQAPSLDIVNDAATYADILRLGARIGVCRAVTNQATGAPAIC